MSPYPTDGDTRICPECGDALVFSSRYPVLAVGMAQRGDRLVGRIHYEQAWVCRNGGCTYRDLVKMKEHLVTAT